MKSGWDRCGRSKRERGIAQLAEHRSPKPKVGGSIPSAPAPEHFSVVCSVSLRARSFGALNRERGIAQLAEHRSPKPKVGGSIPSAPAPEHFSVVCSVSLRARSFGALT